MEKKAVELYKNDPSQAVKYLTEYTNDALNKVERGWWDFAFHLIGKCPGRRNINEEGNRSPWATPPSTLKKWLRRTGFLRDLEKKKSGTTGK
ncbi:hypothetical protein MASR2M79_17590 [Aminivibrio sp.]